MQPVTSDEREKEALKAVDASPGYSYDYKDPEAMGATSGRQFGVMAQDLEKTPAGRSVQVAKRWSTRPGSRWSIRPR